MAGRPRNAYSPLNPDASVGRVDQGVDFHQPEPYRAIGSGRIYHIDPNFYNGTPAVYEQLDTPITVDGRSYSQVYYSETPALVTEGQPVAAGANVIAGGSAELGFASGNLPAGHSDWSPAKDAANHQTQPGLDFLSFIRRGAAPPTALPPQDASNTTDAGSIRLRPSSGGVTGFLGSAGSTFEGVADSLWKAGVNAVEGPMRIVLAALWLLKPSNWLRMVEFIVGMGLIVMGLVGMVVALLAKSELARDAAAGASAAPGPVGALGKAVTLTGSRKHRRNAARTAGERSTKSQRELIDHAESQPTSRRVHNMRRKTVSHTLEVDRKPTVRSTSTERADDQVVIPF